MFIQNPTPRLVSSSVVSNHDSSGNNNNNNDTYTSSTANIIDKPGTFDILCGKDKTYNKHHGNRIFREMIVSYQDVYSKAANKHDKMQITKEIVSSLQTMYNARFIKGCTGKNNQGKWQEISNQVARDKVSHALRFASRSGSASPPPPPQLASQTSSSSSPPRSPRPSTVPSARPRRCRRSHSCNAAITTMATSISSNSAHTVSNNSSSGSLLVSTATHPAQNPHRRSSLQITPNSSLAFGAAQGRRRSSATIAAAAALAAFDAATFTDDGDDTSIERSNNSSGSSAFFEDHIILFAPKEETQQEEEDEEEDDLDDDDEEDMSQSSSGHDNFLLEPTPLPVSSMTGHAIHSQAGTYVLRSDEELDALMKEPVILAESEWGQVHYLRRNNEINSSSMMEVTQL